MLPHLNPWEEASINAEHELETEGDEERKPFLTKRMREKNSSKGMRTHRRPSVVQWSRLPSHHPAPGRFFVFMMKTE